MAKTGIHIKRCNVCSVEDHNDRKKKYLQKLQEAGRQLYFFQDLTHTNKSWVNGRYAGKTVADHFADMCQRYKSMTGQAPQLKDRERVDKKTGKVKVIAGWSPIREGVSPIKADTQIRDFAPFVKWLREHGLDVIRIDLHHDEGHEDEKGERKMNHHAHVVIDWTDHRTGKTVKLTKTDIEEMQTVLAESLGMERGKPKAESGRVHVNHAEWRERKAAEHFDQLAKDYESLRQSFNDLVLEHEDLKKDYNNLVNQFNELSDRFDAKQTLLDALNGQIDHARATAAAMGIEVSAECQNTSYGMMLYAYAGKQPLPPRTLDRDDFVAFKTGRMPVEILVAKYHPAVFQPSPKVVEQYVKNHPKR